MRSGADRNANVRLLVSDDGTVRCNRGKPVPMGAERLLTARQLERDLETQAALGLELPKGRDAILSYRARLEAGTIAFSDRSRGRPALLQPPRRLHERRRQARLQARAMTEVGRVAALWRYPVKSMAGEALEEVEVSWHGLAGDRRWAFIRDGIPRSGFPWLTIRERSDMGRYRPSFLDPARPDASRTVVRTPAGAALDVVDPALAAELGDGVRVIKQDRGVFDTMPLSLVSTQTLAALGELAGRELDAQRFRPNLLVDARPTARRSRRRRGSARCCGSAGCGCASTSATSAA